MGWRSGFWLERIGEMSTETGVSSLVRRQGALFFLNFFMDLRFCLCQVCSDCEAAGRDVNLVIHSGVRRALGQWGLQLQGARGSLDGRCRQEERKGPESHHRGSEHSDGGPGEWAEIQGTQQRAVSFS